MFVPRLSLSLSNPVDSPFLSRKTTTYPLSIPCTMAAVGEIEYIRSIPIHIKAPEIQPLIQAYVGIHVGTRHQKLTTHTLCTRSWYSSCFSLFILPLFPDTWRVPGRYRTSSCQNHRTAGN